MKKECVIYGAGTYGQVYATYLKESYEVVGYIDDNLKLLGKKFENIPVLGDSEYLFSKLDRQTAIFVPIGSNNARIKIFNKLKAHNFPTPSFIHRDTQIHQSVVIGNGVYILPSSSIMPFTTINDYTMISMGVNIAHHVLIEKGCFFSQGSNIGASIHVKEQAYCGISSTVMTGVETIGAHSLIGAGAVVIRNVPDFATMVGVPAKELKK